MVSILTWFMGAGNILSAVQLKMTNNLIPINEAIPLQLQAGNHITAALAGFTLFMLAGNLWRRKLAGWLLTILLLAISTIIQLFKGPASITSGLAVGLIILLLLLRRSYDCPSDPLSVRRGMVALASVFILSLVIGVIGFTLEGILSHHPVRFQDAISQTLAMLVSFSNPNHWMVNGFSRYIADAHPSNGDTPTGI
jgi:lysylphosphatidylglycerol synthetase-like protein (DUF2156 family)